LLLLVAAGADPHAVNKDGRNLLHFATRGVPQIVPESAFACVPSFGLALELMFGPCLRGVTGLPHNHLNLPLLLYLITDLKVQPLVDHNGIKFNLASLPFI
jgi:hypothetical protein